MATSVLEAAVMLREAVAAFEPALLSGEQCARLAEELAGAEKACAAARLLASARAVDCGAHQERGFRDGAAWVARHTGATPGQARQVLATAAQLKDCPETEAAMRAGELSLAQTCVLAQAETETPGAEAVLLNEARSGDLSRLRDRARAYRQAHTDVEDLHRQQHAARRFGHWRDRQGMVCFAGALAPEVGVPLVNRIEVETDRIRRQARRDGSSEPREAHAADAVAQMLAGSGRGRSMRADMVVVVDLNAYRRGHTHHGEVCHLIGGGPLPVEVVRELCRDAFVKVAFHDGVDIVRVTHLGRHIPAELRTALDLGPVPEFTGAECADCGRRWGLEWDHVNPVANQGPTSYNNLKPRCWACHHDKTEQDRQAGLLGPNPP